MTGDVVARFEFRAFAQSFGLVIDNIRRRSECQGITESREKYLITSRESVNVKTRDGRLEIKQLIEKREGLERWRPVAEADFPLSRDFVRTNLWPMLGISDDEVDRSELAASDSLDEGYLVRQLVPRCAGLWAATVFKRRFRFRVHDCPTEIDQLLINGAAIESVAVESEDAGVVLAVVDKVGLIEYENVNYPRAIRRVMGFETWPHEITHG